MADADDVDDDYYPGEYPDYPDLTGLLVTTPRVTVSNRARVVGPDQLLLGCVCRCGCGPGWAVEFEAPALDATRPWTFFAHDLVVLSSLEQLASLPEDDSGEHAPG